MFKVLLHAVNRKHFFGECVGPNDFGPSGYPAFISFLGINLPDPAGISVTGRTYQDLGVEIAKVEGLRIGLEGCSHGFVR